jgi:hypothetical protein
MDSGQTAATVEKPFHTDEELQMFYELEGESIKRAAAAALETIAANTAYIEKQVKLLDLSTNGPAIAKELVSRAKLLRDQARDEETVGGPQFVILELQSPEDSFLFQEWWSRV